MHALSHREVINDMVSDKVLGWLATGTDLSMVGGAFRLDPLAHTAPDRGVMLWNKTGTNDGVRADVGSLQGKHTSVSYAVIANWTTTVDDPRDAVLGGMREIGIALRQLV
jgi:beta-lactamase class A